MTYQQMQYQQLRVNKIIIEGFNHWYGDNHVLKNINMEIKSNIVTAIMGPSGCGKMRARRSTLMGKIYFKRARPLIFLDMFKQLFPMILIDSGEKCL